jgi:hypothetical protein
MNGNGMIDDGALLFVLFRPSTSDALWSRLTFKEVHVSICACSTFVEPRYHALVCGRLSARHCNLFHSGPVLVRHRVDGNSSRHHEYGSEHISSLLSDSEAAVTTRLLYVIRISECQLQLLPRPGM